VSKSRLHPSARLSETEWLLPRLRSFSEHQVASLLPDEFPAYIRILHRAIDVPESGNLSPDLLKPLCEVLARHTGTKDSCLFCLWDGYGWLHNSRPGSNLVFTAAGHTLNETSSSSVPPPLKALPGTKLNLPFRSYYLREGPLDAALDLGWYITAESFVPQSPNLFWPQDRAWCVASEIDLFCTLVAGSEALAGDLLADPRLEASRVFPATPPLQPALRPAPKRRTYS
jgi:hypothetical protein